MWRAALVSILAASSVLLVNCREEFFLLIFNIPSLVYFGAQLLSLLGATR